MSNNSHVKPAYDFTSWSLIKMYITVHQRHFLKFQVFWCQCKDGCG